MSRGISPALVVHGGAGRFDADRAEDAVSACRIAVLAGLSGFRDAGTPTDVVQSAVRILEEEPLLNAGRGSALTRAGTIETDAAIMEGWSLRAGAVGAMVNCGDPVDIARAVLESGEHILLVGTGAWTFARELGFAPTPAHQLVTARARERLADWANKRNLDPEPGTVGACSVDRRGRVAAATSTGGTVGKMEGRVGDTPLIGCGTFADKVAGASATGHGESIIKTTMGRLCVDLIATGRTPMEAAAVSVAEVSKRTRGEAGIVCCDREGRIGLAHSTPDMPFAVGVLTEAGPVVVASAVRVDDRLNLDELLAAALSSQ